MELGKTNTNMKILILITLAVAATAFPGVSERKAGSAKFEGIKGFSRTPYLLPRISPTVIGGQEVVPHSVPYQVSFQYTYDGIWLHYCGGSIVEADKILLAAHCVVEFEGAKFRIVAGEHDLTESDGAEQAVAVAKVSSHPRFTFDDGDYDYAVLRLATNLTFNEYVAPISLPISTDFVPSGKCKLTGWGFTRNDGTGEISDKLHEVTLPLVDQEKCTSAYVDFVWHVTDRMVCAGDDGKGPCTHDSGSPLVCNGVLAGIASWGNKPCAQAQFPGVFARVSAGLDWFAAQ